MIKNKKSIEFNEDLKSKMDLAVQITLFISLCNRLRSCCLNNKELFKDGTYNEIYVDPLKHSTVRVYFNNDFEDCAIDSGKSKFLFWNQKLESKDALNIYDNTVESNRLLKEAIAHVENSDKPKRRKLNFMK